MTKKLLITDYTLGELLQHNDDSVRRSAISILKQMQRLSIHSTIPITSITSNYQNLYE